MMTTIIAVDENTIKSSSSDKDHYESVQFEVISNQSDSNNSGEREGKFSVSCKGCRHAHHACDKQLPSCSECLRKGKECVYEKPKRRGRPVSNSGSACTNLKFHVSKQCKLMKQQENVIVLEKEGTNVKRFHPYLCQDKETVVSAMNIYSKGGNSVEIDTVLITRNGKLEIIDFFYECIDPGFELISRNEMKNLLNKVNNNEGIKSMLYSIQALCEQRLANTKRSELAAQESRKYLATSDYNIYTKISYALLINYLGGEGEDILAQSYLNHLNRILGNEASTLRGLIMKADRVFKVVDNDYNGTIESTLFFLEVFRPFQFDLKKYADEGVTVSNFNEWIQIVEAVKETMTTMIDNGSCKYSDTYVKIKNVWNKLIFVSGFSSIFFALGLEGEQVDLMVDRADKIMEDYNVEMSPVSIFPYLSLYMNYRVKHFGNILTEFQNHILNGMGIRSIFCLEKFQKYFNGVVIYLKVMNEFSKRYKRIGKQFGNLCRNLQAIAKWKFDVQTHVVSQLLDDEFHPTSEILSEQETQYLSCLEKAKLHNPSSNI